MVLVRLTEPQVAEYWHILKFAIGSALPPIAGESPEKMNNILKALLLNKMQCWIVTKNDEESIFRVVVTTVIVHDNVTETNSLLLYSIYAFRMITQEDLDAIDSALTAYGKVNKCNRMIAYSKEPHVLELLHRQGFGEDWHFSTRDF